MIGKLWSRIKETGKKLWGTAKEIGKQVDQHAATVATVISGRATDTAQLTGQARTMALMSEAAYQASRPGVIDGYSYVPELSSERVAVYHRPGTAVLAFRGTAALADLQTDLHIAQGSTGEAQFAEAEEVYQRARQQWPDAEVVATGHSKGGSLALYLNMKHGVQAEVFNPGVGVGGGRSAYGHKLMIHAIEGDPVSALSGMRGGTLKLYRPKMGETAVARHAMANFL